MRHLCCTFLALGLVLALLQAPQPAEAKIVKKTVKELKKLKKYAFLLAANKKKLYAIPFPMPLPVFVKRQHIYTQVPIIPRYVQHPQPYGAPVHSSDYAELMSGSYIAPEIRAPSSFGDASSSSSSGEPMYNPRKKATSSSSSSTSSSPSSTSDLASQYLGSSGKYLTQIAGLLSQTSPMIGGTNRDLFSKLLSGQARILPPTALLSAIKSPARPYEQKQQDSADQQQRQRQQQQQHQQQHQQQDQNSDSKSHSSSSSSSSGSVNYDDPPGGSTSAKSADTTESNKPSASELYKAYRPMRPSLYAPPSYLTAGYPFATMPMNPLLSPMAALARAQALTAARTPLTRLPTGSTNELLADHYEGREVDSLHEPQDVAGSQDHGSVIASPGAPDYATGPYAALLKQRQQALHPQSQPEQLLLAVQKLQRQQMLARQQEALKMALLREQDVANRLAESRQALQWSLALPPDQQASLLKQYRQLVVA